MSKYGLTQEGYKTKPFNVMVKEVQDALTSSLGPIYFAEAKDPSPSLADVLINTFLIEVAKIDLKGEEVYNASYPNTATGYSLDGIADFNGIKRLAATYSTVTVQMTILGNFRVVMETPYSLHSFLQKPF